MVIVMPRRESEEKSESWAEVLKQLAITMLSMISLLVRAGCGAVKSRYTSEVQKEIERKRRRERNRSQRERELDMAK